VAHSIPSKILVCQRVPKKSAVLACLTMGKVKMIHHVPNKKANLLKKISLMGTELAHRCILESSNLPVTVAQDNKRDENRTILYWSGLTLTDHNCSCENSNS